MNFLIKNHAAFVGTILAGLISHYQWDIMSYIHLVCAAIGAFAFVAVNWSAQSRLIFNQEIKEKGANQPLLFVAQCTSIWFFVQGNYVINAAAATLMGLLYVWVRVQAEYFTKIKY